MLVLLKAWFVQTNQKLRSFHGLPPPRTLMKIAFHSLLSARAMIMTPKYITPFPEPPSGTSHVLM